MPEEHRTLADLPAPDELAARRLVALLTREGVARDGAA